MQIQINYGDVQSSDGLENAVRDQLEKKLAHLSDSVTRVEVHLRDDNAGKSGPQDKRVMMEGRIASDNPLAVEAQSDDMYSAIADAAGKLQRAISTRVAKK